MKSNITTALKVIGGLIVAFLAVTGVFLQKMETIPSKAQVDVFPSQKHWLPHAKFIGKSMDTMMEDPQAGYDVLTLMSEVTPATWGDISNGEYEGFTIHPAWGNDNDFTTGKNQSLLSSWIFGSEPRWNEDGTWNY